VTIVSVFGEFFHSDFDENYKTLFQKKEKKLMQQVLSPCYEIFFF
jgi:hypothetical protein